MNAPRKIPVGYSAADDLRFRISLSKYLECGDELTSVDFYGVNSYQWCGSQTFTSSGYNTLVQDYLNYSLPLILSEYGCNAVMPRLFEEVEAIYSPLMARVFSGGLVYEYSQEPNNYGLVEIDHKGNVYLRPDFDTLKQQLEKIKNNKIPLLDVPFKPLTCDPSEYPNINSKVDPPQSFATDFISNKVKVRRGSFIEDLSIPQIFYKIYDTMNREIVEKYVVIVQRLHDSSKNTKGTGSTLKDNDGPIKQQHLLEQMKNKDNSTEITNNSNGEKNEKSNIKKNSATRKKTSFLGHLLVALAGNTLIGM